jgi:hypothetical protein
MTEAFMVVGVFALGVGLIWLCAWLGKQEIKWLERKRK